MVKANRWITSLVILVSTLASLASATSTTGSTGEHKRFEWTTDSKEAKTMLTELQARVENFQLGAGTIELARKIVAADPEFAMGVYYLSATLPPPDGQTELDKAIELSKNASDGERRFIEAMAKARANGGANFQEAVPLLEALAKDYPEERLVRMILGQIYQGSGDAKKARAAFEKALEIGPKSNRALSFIANDNLLEGKYAQARSTFESIQNELPQGSAPAPLRYGVAFSHLYEGDPERAVEALETYLKEYRDSGQTQAFPDVFIWNSIARIHLESGQTANAMTAYKKGYESIPASNLPEDQKQVWFGRLKHGECRTLAKMGKHDEALAKAKEIHQMITEGGEQGEQYLPAYHYLMGYLMLEAGKHAKAVEHLEQANPNDPFHTLLLARAYEGAGNKNNALKSYEAVVDSNANGLERALAYREAKHKLSKS